MESGIRDIFIFLKLSWGLENDMKTFQKIDDLEVFLPNIDRGPHVCC